MSAIRVLLWEPAHSEQHYALTNLHSCLSHMALGHFKQPRPSAGISRQQLLRVHTGSL